MRRLFTLLIFVSVLGTIDLFSADFIPCKLLSKDSTVITGFAIVPDMLDDNIKFKNDTNSNSKKIMNDKLLSATFTEKNKEITYELVLTYRNYGNKKINNTKTWLKVLRTGYMSYYSGYQSGYNFPSMNLWYCKKANDSVAYFITMKYTGGLVLTVGTGIEFKENASFYFSDYKDLAEKISNGVYKFEEMELLVDEYNKWMFEKSTNR